MVSAAKTALAKRPRTGASLYMVAVRSLAQSGKGVVGGKPVVASANELCTREHQEMQNKQRHGWAMVFICQVSLLVRQAGVRRI